MDNLKYYNDSFAYDYDRFITVERPKRAEIHKYPNKKQGKRSAKNTSANYYFARNIAIALLVLAAVFGSLYLRAEISSLKAQINGVNKEIVELESESVRLDVEIERKVSMTNLENAALELGMQKCEKSQVTYIRTNEIDTAENVKGKLTAQVE